MPLMDAHATHALRSEGISEAVIAALMACGRSPRAGDAFAALASSVGFDGFSYILLGGSPTQPRLLEHWTTSGPGWIARYAARGYHLVDARVLLTRYRSVPVAWGADAGEARTREFMVDAKRHGIRGGVAWSQYDARVGRAVVAWDSQRRTAGTAESTPLRLRLGSLALLAGLIHEALVVHCNTAAPTRSGAPLTDRERECVALVARGMTSADVGIKLGITTRTANFHIGNVMTKLGAVSRGEAIARAVSARLVSIDAWGA